MVKIWLAIGAHQDRKRTGSKAVSRAVGPVANTHEAIHGAPIGTSCASRVCDWTNSSTNGLRTSLATIKKWAGIAGILMTMLFVRQALATDLELTEGTNRAYPLAIVPFEGGKEASALMDVITEDLNSTGQFRMIHPSGYPSYSVPSLRQAGAESVLSSKVVALGSGRYEIQYKLLDTIGDGRILVSQTLQAYSGEWRSLAHHIADMVYEKITGVQGAFATKIAYVLVKKDQGRRRHYLEIADWDGFNPQTLLISSEPIMSPAWSPDASQIAYVSFEKKKAQIFTVAVVSGKRRLVTDFAGINGAPAWSPDGKSLALVLSKGGSPKIYTVSLATGNMKQLTFGDAIDTEPRFSPDGSTLLFTSGRGGSPQVYQLRLSDGQIVRMTYEGNYNARASFTPSQKEIVMLHREDKNFSIAVQEVNGPVVPLTYSSFDESPTVAPNGRLVLYASRALDKGVLGVVSIDGKSQKLLPKRDGDMQDPAWSPWLK